MSRRAPETTWKPEGREGEAERAREGEMNLHEKKENNIFSGFTSGEVGTRFLHRENTLKLTV